MDAKWTHVLILNIVHEKTQNAVVLIQLDPFGWVLKDLLVSELVTKHVPLETLEKEHLSTSKHATPSSVRSIA